MARSLNQRIRFEILRRDGHTCRYCGAKAPDVTLVIDHVIPVSLGGTDEPGNLVTSCHGCNAGKGSSSPDAPLVQDVQEDALRWAKAMQAAQELAERQGERGDEVCSKFQAHWSGYTYRPSGEPVPLPFDWRPRLLDLVRGPGLTSRDLAEAIDLTMGAPRVRDEFTYCIGILRNKLTARQVIARQMIEDGF
jgi:hypothetical protein